MRWQLSISVTFSATLILFTVNMHPALWFYSIHTNSNLILYPLSSILHLSILSERGLVLHDSVGRNGDLLALRNVAIVSSRAVVRILAALKILYICSYVSVHPSSLWAMYTMSDSIILRLHVIYIGCQSPLIAPPTPLLCTPLLIYPLPFSLPFPSP